MTPSTGGRPLSPHLQVFRWHITMALSILHRATGVALGVGMLLMVWWVLAAAAGPESYGRFVAFAGSPIGILLLLGWSFSLFLHLCTGIRHLVWDTGTGLDIATVQQSSWTIVIAAVGLTVLAWIAAIVTWGNA
jgi:succinate dehydrogenase / fumarate reductase, cytochrome b subunit